MIGMAGDNNKKVVGKEIEPLLKAFASNPKVKKKFGGKILSITNKILYRSMN